MYNIFFFFFSSRRRHTRLQGDWSSDVCSSDLSADNPAEWISNSDIGRTLEAIAAKQVLLVSDSCYSGSLTREAKVEKSDILPDPARSEEHTSELQSPCNLVC